MRRRRFIQHATLCSAVTLVPHLSGCADDETAAEPAVFSHGVASGDPTAEAVIIWTRVSGAAQSVDVIWTVALDEALSQVVASGTVSTSADRDYTVKVDVTGLEPHTTYHYGFSALGEASMVGRTKTMAADKAAPVRLGVVSCASYHWGYFNAYRFLAEKDVDAVVHLGDYIYEYGDGEYGDARTCDPPHETVTLEDYRRRYARYRTDPDLMLIHQKHPFIVVWDDHEVTDDYWEEGAVNHQADEGDFGERRSVAAKAFFEWIPIRENEDGTIYRTLSLGPSADLILLDTRGAGRDEVAENQNDPLLEKEDRTVLGSAQEQWVAEQLSASTATFKLVGQQVMMGQLPQFTNTDAWDGYPFARQRLFDVFEKVDNVIVLTGDFHCSWAHELTKDPASDDYDPQTGKGAVGCEFVTPAITAPGFPDESAALGPAFVSDNRHTKYADLVKRGYLVVEVTDERVTATFHYVDNIESSDATERSIAPMTVRAGTSHIEVG